MPTYAISVVIGSGGFGEFGEKRLVVLPMQNSIQVVMLYYISWKCLAIVRAAVQNYGLRYHYRGRVT